MNDGCVTTGMLSQSCLTLVTPYTIARQVPLSTGFFRREYWSGLPFPPPGDLPNQGIEPESPGSLPLHHQTPTYIHFLSSLSSFQNR